MDYKVAQGNFLEWWKYSVSWLWWCWLHNCPHFPKFILFCTPHKYKLYLNRNERTCPQWDAHGKVPSNHRCNGHKPETYQMSINRWVDTRWHTPAMEHYSAKRNEPRPTHRAWDVSHRNHADWKNPDTKRANSLWFHLYESPESGTLCSDKNQTSGGGGWQGLGGVGGEDYQGEEVTSGVVGMVMNLTWRRCHRYTCMSKLITLYTASLL